jgi:hypothetical protein
MSGPSHSSRFDHPNNMIQIVRVLKNSTFFGTSFSSPGIYRYKDV